MSFATYEGELGILRLAELVKMANFFVGAISRFGLADRKGSILQDCDAFLRKSEIAMM
jgi:hypothetical protein